MHCVRLGVQELARQVRLRALAARTDRRRAVLHVLARGGGVEQVRTLRLCINSVLRSYIHTSNEEAHAVRTTLIRQCAEVLL